MVDSISFSVKSFAKCTQRFALLDNADEFSIFRVNTISNERSLEVSRTIASKIKELTAEKQVLARNCESMQEKFDKLFEKGCKTGNIDLFQQANGLKLKITESKDTISKIEEEIFKLKCK